MPAVDYVAQQLEVPASAWFDYPLKGRSGSRDREQLRAFLGFRQAANDDMEPVQRWLSQEVVPQDQAQLQHSCHRVPNRIGVRTIDRRSYDREAPDFSALP